MQRTNPHRLEHSLTRDSHSTNKVFDRQNVFYEILLWFQINYVVLPYLTSSLLFKCFLFSIQFLSRAPIRFGPLTVQLEPQ